MDAPYYPCYNSWYPIDSCYSDMCQASRDSMLRMQQSKLNAYTFEKLTIYDFARLVFPDDPIRDYVEKKVTEIEERYRWIDEFY